MSTWLANRFLNQKPALGEAGLQGFGSSLQTSETVECLCAAPFGVRYRAPGGTKMLMQPAAGGSVCLGEISADNPGLNPGELSITMPSGAKIHLKNDGTVVINSTVTIGADGTVYAKGFVTV